MLTYIIRRLLSAIPLLLGITIISFAVIKLAPGKPVLLQYSLNPKVSFGEIQRLEKLEGLDKPVLVQYAHWLRNLAHFNFGYSLSDGRPIKDKIAERIPITFVINLCSLILVLAIAIPLGVASATKPGSLFDHCTTVVSFILFAAPTFWLGLMLMQLVCIQWKWLPISGLMSLDFQYLSWWQKTGDLARHLILPIFVSSLGGFAGVSRYMRSSMMEALTQPYIYTARAKGLPLKHILYRHALRNALLPIVTILGLSIPGLLGGSIIFESIFAIPGLGRLFYEAAMMRDIKLIMAEVVLVSILTLVGNLVADISYAYVDPRIRYNR